LGGAGCGSAPDARDYGDLGANTLGHLFDAHPGLQLPSLFSLGLWKILTSDVFDARSQHTRASYGRMRPQSSGKDSTTGHWEIAGIVLPEPFATFTSFPDELVQAIQRDAGIEFVGNQRQSCQGILEELGDQHLRSGLPILYSSTDSTLEIAAHDAILSKKQLGQICQVARRHARQWRIPRVVAQSFSGSAGSFEPSAEQVVYPIVPPRSILNALADTGVRIQAVGKVHEHFAGSGITDAFAATSGFEAMSAIDKFWPTLDDGLLFATLDASIREPEFNGVARTLTEFDSWLSGFLKKIESDDLVIITADHGSDPTFGGSGSTREEVPLMIIYDKLCAPLGTRRTLADVSASLGDFFCLAEKWPVGTSFLRAAGHDRRLISQ
jgi:phosphopentomutase